MAETSPPVKRAGICCPPFLGALTVEQLLQGEMRGRTTDANVPFLRFDIQLLAAAQLGGLHDLARKPDGQVLPPSADADLRHRNSPPACDIHRISPLRIGTSTG